MIKLVIFDYDGLLVKSETLAFIAEKKVLSQFGKNLTREIFDRFLGYSVKDTLKGYQTIYKLNISLDNLLQKREKIINRLIETDLKLMPGAKSLLGYLKARKVKMVIASSGEYEYIKKGLKKLNIENYFQNITCVSEVKKGKPNPDLFLEALKKNNIKSVNAIVFEDSISGINASKKAKIFCIAVPPKEKNDFKEYRIADLILDNLKKAKNTFQNCYFEKT
ncbi:MAG: HAD family phosphatase [bacterium]|nr:HAD family phosphatase [bacterium]